VLLGLALWSHSLVITIQGHLSQYVDLQYLINVFVTLCGSYSLSYKCKKQLGSYLLHSGFLIMLI